MSKKSAKPLAKPKLIQLYEEDVERLQRYFPGLQLSRVIRELVHRRLNDTEHKLSPVEIPE